MAKGANEIIQTVKWLEADQLLRDQRDRARRRHELHSMLTVPDLPPHMTRGDSVSTNTPRVMWVLNSILADCRSYPTITSVISQGKSSVDLQDQADEAEKWYAVKRAQLDDGGRNSHDCRWHQGATGWVYMILHCDGAGSESYKQGNPWRVEIPDPLTCFAPMEGGPCRPSIMGRRYTILVSDVINRYKGQQRTQFEGQTLKYTGEEWEWAYPLGEDEPVETGDVGNLTTRRVGLPGVADVVEMIELYQPDHVYHVALHGTIGAEGSRNSSDHDGTQGQIVWEAETMTDGIPVVVVPGHVTPLRVPVERFQPTQWALMQCAMVINMIRGIRMTKAFNWKPDFLVEQGPEMVAALKDAGILQEPSNIDIERGGPNVINVTGKPMLWVAPSDDDLNKLDESWTAEMNMIADTQMAVTTSEVAKAATLGGIQLAIGVRKRQLGPMLSNLDWGWAEIMKMVRASIKQYKDKFPIYALGGEKYAKGELKANTSVTIDASMVDFPHEIVVSTQSMTEEERRMMIQDWSQREAMGLSTFAEGIEAAGYQDVADQIEKLSIDLALKHTTSGWVQQMDAVASDYIRTSGGILVTFGMPPSLPAPVGRDGNAGAGPDASGRLPPATSGVVGGSGANPGMPTQ